VSIRTQVEETIEVIRPALQADGGDIILRDVDETTGIVSVTLTGACGTCPASDQTLKAGIERIMRDRIDGAQPTRQNYLRMLAQVTARPSHDCCR
jgi:Fe-S cluster biogenesis protein NfuA